MSNRAMIPTRRSMRCRSTNSRFPTDPVHRSSSSKYSQHWQPCHSSRPVPTGRSRPPSHPSNTCVDRLRITPLYQMPPIL